MKRHALIVAGEVTKIITGDKPSEDWVDYPDDAPDISLEYTIVLEDGVFINKKRDFSLLESVEVKRSKKYPSVGDQLDAIWKALDTLNLPAETKAVLDRIKQVKQEIPKPDKPK